jgi:glutathione S-transferase
MVVSFCTLSKVSNHSPQPCIFKALTRLADETSYINYVKPLILAEELMFPHCLAVIDTKTEWAYQIHPERMVPALRDQDPETGQSVSVFEGTACLYYLADRFDRDGDWLGRTAFERGNVHAWTAYQTAGIG